MLRMRVVVLLSMVTISAACSDDGGGEGAKPSTTVRPHVVPALVYFARDEKVATAGRSVEAPAVARGALQALLAGPDRLERDIGMRSEIPTGTELLGVSLSDGDATVDFDPRFESGGGSLSMNLRVAQVVFTVTQFDTVERVNITIDGRAVDAIGGEGVPARGLTRADFEDVTPFILVESPVPGATATSPLSVSGTSNTFEATVNYTFTDPDGAVLAEGYTTATSGTGTWGTFAFAASFATSGSGLGELSVYQISPESGERRDVYDVPVRMR